MVEFQEVRPARMRDCAEIRSLIAASSRELAKDFYGKELIEAALNTVLGVDTQLISDRTYFVAEHGARLVGCGGWSRRRTLYGSDAVHGRDDSPLDPATEAAKIRAYFVHPKFCRRGIGSAILERCESEAKKAGFRKLELGATLSGVAFYEARGYVPGESSEYECAPGQLMRIVSMSKLIG